MAVPLTVVPSKVSQLMADLLTVVRSMADPSMVVRSMADLSMVDLVKDD